LFFFFRNVIDGKHCIRGANRDACAAIDALDGIDKELARGFEAGFVLLGMNAICGAHVDAEGIFDAGIGDYISHGEGLLKVTRDFIPLGSNTTINTGENYGR
jgi:hypothetical protein